MFSSLLKDLNLLLLFNYGFHEIENNVRGNIKLCRSNFIYLFSDAFLSIKRKTFSYFLNDFHAFGNLRNIDFELYDRSGDKRSDLKLLNFYA